MTRLDRKQFRYAACYCEENIWHLAGDARILGDERHVVFISNAARCCPLWAQRSSPHPSEPALWDYHVVYLVSVRGTTLVYDLDTTLEFPVPLKEYLEATF